MAELEHTRLASFLYILPIAGMAYCPRVTRCLDLGHDYCHPGRIEASCRPASRVGNVGREMLNPVDTTPMANVSLCMCVEGACS